jgi:hypothetical protein
MILIFRKLSPFTIDLPGDTVDKGSKNISRSHGVNKFRSTEL